MITVLELEHESDRRNSHVALRVAQLFAVIAVTVGIVYTLAPELGRISIEDLANYPPDVAQLFVATLLLLMFSAMHAWLWRAITFAFDAQKVHFRTALYILFVGGLGRYIPGKVWQVAGIAWLSQRSGVSAIAASTASIVAQFIFIITGLLYLGVMLPGDEGMQLHAVSAAVAIGLLLTAYVGRHWITMHIRPLQPAVNMLDRISPGQILLWCAGYLVSWILFGAAFLLFTNAFIPLAWPDYRHVAGSVAAAYLGGVLFFLSVAGIGVREAMLATLLGDVMPAPAAIVVAVASRLWFTLGELLPILFGKKPRPTEVDPSQKERN